MYGLSMMQDRLESYINRFREDFDEHVDETNAHDVSLEEARLISAVLEGDVEVDGTTKGTQFNVNGGAMIQENSGEADGIEIDPQQMHDWDVETDFANVYISTAFYPPRYETFEDLDQNADDYRGGMAYVSDDRQMYYRGGGEWHPMGPTDA